MDRLTRYCFFLLLISTIAADANDSSVEEHRVPRVSGRIVKVYSGSRPEPFICNSEGYKSDPYSCTSFYRCVRERNGKFNLFRYQCAPGTVYDPDLETCNHPRSTRRTECGGMRQPTEIIDSTLVNEIESQKVLPRPIASNIVAAKKELPRPINTNELAFIKETTIAQPAGSHWVTSQSVSTKQSQKTTVYQTPSTPAAYFADTTKFNPGYNYVLSTNIPWISNKEENNWPKTTSDPKITSSSKNIDICSDDGFTGDIDNCRKFYRCVGNQRGGFLRYEFFCSESTVWDEDIQSCNHPWAVKRSKCGRSMSFAEKTVTATSTTDRFTTQELTPSTAEYGQKTNKTIQQQLQISHGSKVTQTQTQISHSDQVIQNQTQIHYGDRITPNKDTETKQNQTQIAHGSAVSQAQTQIDYGNKGMQTQLQIDHSNDSSQSQTQINESTTSQTTTSKQDSNQSNNNQCYESGFIGDSNDCKKFYRCVDSGRGTFTKYEYLCGDGTVWDQSIEACNHAWAVKECGGHSHSETQSSTMQSTTYYADTTTTTQSTSEAPEPEIDDIDVGYGNQGQSETTTFSSTTSTKTTTSMSEEPQYETTKEPQKEPNNKNECKSSGFMGDSNNCKKFYRCVDNGMGGYTRHEFTCGEGTVWDSSIEACNHAWAVEKCGGSGGTSESAGTSESSQTKYKTTTETNVETTTTSLATPVDKNTNEPIHTTTSSSISSSTSTSSESNESNICKSSGFMGDNKNCKKFYRCVDNGDGTYTRYEFTCGEGTVWDSKIEACNHEWAVETCGGNSESTTPTPSTSQHPTFQDEDKENEPTTAHSHETSSTTESSTTTTTVTNDISTTDQTCTGSGFVGDKNDCKKFYRCVENENGGYDRYEFTCGEGTVWDKSISACNHVWAVKDCGASGSGSSQSSSESTSAGTVSSTEPEKESPQHTTEKSTSTTGNPTENEINDGDCESEGFFGSLSDCKKFIRCVDDGKGGFTKYEFNCGEGTTWNQQIEACDHPSPDRPCGQDYQSTTKESLINDEMVTETTTKMTSTTSSSDKDGEGSEVTQKPQSSSGTCDSEGFYGDPSDCNKFYRCVDDGKGGYTKYDFTCGDGTVWNQEILACDHESDDNSCLSSGSRPTEASGSQSQSTTSESHPESTTSSSSNTATNQETDKTDPPASTSSDKCTSDGFFAHPYDCKKFVRCVSNGDGKYSRYEFSCGQGTMWVQEIQACDHDNGDTTCSNQSESITKPQDSGSPSTTESDGSSITESQTQSKEDDEYPTSKQPSNTGSDVCTSEGYFANKNDCKKFYRCVDNEDGGYTKYDFDCGEGTAWDSDIGNCNHINEVSSCSENNKEESHTQQPMKEEETSQTQGPHGTSSTTEGNTSSSSSSEESESGSETESKDECKSEGYYGDSKDCKKFYRCVDDGKGGLTKYDFTCGDGTIWDQDITNCNHPQDVTNPSCEIGGEESTEDDNQTPSSSSTTSSTTSSPDSTASSSSSESTTQSSSNCSQEDSSKKPASSKDISCEKAGYYPNPNDCKKFYRCVDWDGDGKRFSVYHFECGEGTIWDPALDTCNHEESVYPPRDCSQTQAQTESASEGTTTGKQDETTTQESTTSEQTTTQEPSTSEQTTTQQSTTSEKTTTEQSTTSEQTTTQQTTTSEQTTTQQSTTSEQTTSEQTTTQQSTTSEQTTTQQSTTSEQTTTQESTTSEQTTTQQSTTSEQSTQESTTSEQTTTQQSTTSEQTTTEESTTSEQTTQESTTSEQTTQESTTSEQSATSEQTTTEQTTEQTSEQTESSTTESATESSTTEGEKESTTEASSSSEKECPETEDDQNLFVCPTSFKRHPKYCNMFYQCTEDDDTHEVKIATFKCPNDTIYDESQTQCVEESKADKKCDGEMARRHRFKRLNRDSKELITADKESKSCPSIGYYAFEKNVECSNGFLKCERSKSGKIRGFVHQCPDGYIFWSISKRCEFALNIRDCKRSSNDWKGRWNIPIDRKNVAF